jgi:hypothetical protein
VAEKLSGLPEAPREETSCGNHPLPLRQVCLEGLALPATSRCCTREITGWNLSLRCRSEEAIDAVEQSVLARLPKGSREAELTLTTDALHGNAFAAGHHTPPNGVSSSGRQQLHRALSSQLEGGRSLGSRVPQHGGGANVDRKLDRRIQSRPPSPESAKSNASRGVLSMGSYTTFRGPTCLNSRGSLQCSAGVIPRHVGTSLHMSGYPTNQELTLSRA